jgi:predicted glycoside hydrolase/deacetylase ChbG (UPF0249 family)
VLYPVIRAPRGNSHHPGRNSCRRLIVHGDDFGLSPSVNRATILALEKGTLSSASIMVPCPSFEQAATYASRHPQMDIGLHLTLTSEWPNYRWGPVAPREKVPSLLDGDGYFWPDSATVVRRANRAEVSLEIVHQIERALAVGICPTHVDSHMLALLQSPDLYSVYVRVANRFGIPYLSAGYQYRTAFGVMHDRTALDAVYIAYPAMRSENWLSAHVRTVDRLDGCISQLIVHVGFSDDELAALIGDDTPWGAVWRQRDFDAINHKDFRAAIERNGIELVGWRQLQSLCRGTACPGEPEQQAM